ncbi:Adenylate cyclase, partial [Neolecta irregularis DAH-3]
DLQTLETIPVSLFRHAADIVSLNISKNLSLQLPSDILQSCVNLRELRFAYNEARRLMSNLSLAQKLTHLDVSNNRLEDLGNAGLHKIETLVALKLQNNRLSALPAAFADLRHLRSLNISTNNFTEFPLPVCSIASLVDLDVSFNRLESLPAQVGSLHALDRLIANNNRFQGAFPDTMRNMQSLRELDIRFNFFTNIQVLAEIPNLESAYCGNNSATAFDPKLLRLKTLHLSKNPITQFSIASSTQSLVFLTLTSAKLAVIPPAAFDNMLNLERLVLDNNQLSTIPAEIGKLKRLQHFSCIKNLLSSLPPEIGQLTNLKSLDVHNNNLKVLPAEIWQLTNLSFLNASSNVLCSFPAPPPQGSLSSTGTATTTPSDEKIPDPQRKQSVVSFSRMNTTMAATLRTLLLGDNRYSDDVFQELSVLTELRVLNLSFNEIIEVPPSALGRLQNLVELYLSGNELNSLPAEDFERIPTLRILHVNANKLQTLPAELGKIRRLLVLDVGSNSLKYNINNWPYDWNWNWNLDLVYLNMSGNKKLEIRPSISVNPAARERNLSDFTALTKLRVLGLMDVTLMVSSPPDQTEDRRVRTTSSEIHNMSYGMADSLGRDEHLSIIDLVVRRFRGNEHEAVFGLFDGQISSTCGNKISHFLQESFTTYLSAELSRLRKEEGIPDGLRRAFLNINREMGLAAGAGFNAKKGAQPLSQQRPSLVSMLGPETLTCGASALVIYLVGKTMYVANAGDAVALLSKTDGEAKLLSEKHHAALEIDRIREAGGVVSRDGKINDILELSRAIGYFHLVPIVQAAPYITEITLSEQDEFVILGNRELWEYISYQTAVDIARTEREDLMLAAQKLRDFAITYGASSKIMVMIIGVGDLFHKKSKARIRNASAQRGLSGSSAIEEEFILKKKRGKDELPADSDLARLEREVPPPVGELAMVFTDIKNSTALWETNYIAMRSAIKIHNSLMRRQLRIIGGYEVKTEGDAFMVSFPTTFSAMLWCFTVQTQLLLADWPQEILDSPHGKEIFDPVSGNVMYRGISVRMGIHYGSPVCEPDPITRRMDYFGPMVNRASRISAVADGGQITISSDAVREIKALETLLDDGDEEIDQDEFGDEILLASTRRDMSMLKKMGFGLVPIGDRKLKGLENPEFISLVYPKYLGPRLEMDLSSAAKPIVPAGPEQVFQSEQRSIDLRDLRHLGLLCLRLERLCSEYPLPGSTQSKMELLTGPLVIKIKEDEDNMVLAKVLENIVTRIEVPSCPHLN